MNTLTPERIFALALQAGFGTAWPSNFERVTFARLIEADLRAALPPADRNAVLEEVAEAFDGASPYNISERDAIARIRALKSDKE